MSDKPVPKKKALEGELLPPESPSKPKLPDLPSGSPLGIPLFARMKFEAQARAFRAHADFRRSQRESLDVETGLIGAVGARVAAEERLAVALRRQQHLGKILDADEAKLLAELDAVFSGIAAAKTAERERAEDHALERRVRKAELEALALEAEARLERIRNPPQVAEPKPDADAKLTRAERIARDIRRVRKDELACRARDDVQLIRSEDILEAAPEATRQAAHDLGVPAGTGATPYDRPLGSRLVQPAVAPQNDGRQRLAARKAPILP